MTMTKKIAHKTGILKGRAKMTVGRITGNRRLRAAGRRDQAMGNIKEAGAKLKGALKR